MPMGGGGTRFGNHGFNVPKPLIEIYSKPFFYWATLSISKFVDISTITFVVLQEHIDKFQIDKKILEYFPNAKIQIIPSILPGAILTCLRGVENITNGEPILFNDCDHLFICKNFYDFCNDNMYNSIDAGLLTFKSNDPKFSYAVFNNDGFVIKTVEKEVISNEAICGAYYFKNKEIFANNTEIYLNNCHYSEFFVSGVYNVLAERGCKIKSFQVDEHISFGTPSEYNDAQSSIIYKRLL